jgi:hypothetical protein
VVRAFTIVERGNTRAGSALQAIVFTSEFFMGGENDYDNDLLGQPGKAEDSLCRKRNGPPAAACFRLQGPHL